jgi:hypothetical protein
LEAWSEQGVSDEENESDSRYKITDACAGITLEQSGGEERAGVEESTALRYKRTALHRVLSDGPGFNKTGFISHESVWLRT